MKALLSTLVILHVFAASMAIRCYVCTDCSDDSALTDDQLQDCGNTTDACEFMDQNGVVSRGCAVTSSTGCRTSGRLTMCVCGEDLCNGRNLSVSTTQPSSEGNTTTSKTPESDNPANPSEAPDSDLPATSSEAPDSDSSATPVEPMDSKSPASATTSTQEDSTSGQSRVTAEIAVVALGLLIILAN